jgi:hypothetical protein
MRRQFPIDREREAHLKMFWWEKMKCRKVSKIMWLGWNRIFFSGSG